MWGPGMGVGRELLHCRPNPLSGTVSGFLESVLGQVGVAHGHLRIGVAQGLLDLIKAVPGIHEHAGITMAQVVEPETAEISSFANAFPVLGQMAIRSTLADEQMTRRVHPSPFQLVQDGQGNIVERDVAFLTKRLSASGPAADL